MTKEINVDIKLHLLLLLDQKKMYSNNNIVIAPAKTDNDKIDEIPVIWIEKIVKSTDGDGWYKCDDNGGYTVHPVPEFGKNKLFNNNKNKDGGSNQNLTLFIRGNALSGNPNVNGIKKFPNPPIINVITIKKLLKKHD